MDLNSDWLHNVKSTVCSLEELDWDSDDFCYYFLVYLLKWLLSSNCSAAKPKKPKKPAPPKKAAPPKKTKKKPKAETVTEEPKPPQEEPTKVEEKLEEEVTKDEVAKETKPSEMTASPEKVDEDEYEEEEEEEEEEKPESPEFIIIHDVSRKEFFACFCFVVELKILITLWLKDTD